MNSQPRQFTVSSGARWAFVAVVVFLAADFARLPVLSPRLDRAVTNGLETAVTLFGTLACVIAARRSSGPPRALWASTALYFVATALGDAHDVMLDAGVRAPIVLAVTETIGWVSYLPLAFLVFFPVSDGLAGKRRGLALVDFAQVTIAIALLYFRFVYLPHALAASTWDLAGRAEAIRNVLISGGLLLRAGLDPSRQARAVYARVGGAFGIITASYLIPGSPTEVIRPAALLSLGLLALLWLGGPTVQGGELLRRTVGTRLTLSMFAAANLVVVVLLAGGAPARFRGLMILVTVLSIALFIARGILAEARRFATERELRTSEERYAKTFRASPDGIAIRAIGADGLIEVNDRFAAMLGYQPSELLGQSLVELGVVSPAAGDEFFRRLERTGEVREFEFTVRRSDGVQLDMLTSAEMVEIGGRRCALMIFRDVTAQKQAEAEALAASEERRRLYVRLANVEEDERRALHAELHDQVGANLAALRLELDVAAGLLARDDAPGTQKHLTGAREVAAETISMARDLMAELRPAALDDYGLAAALRTLAESQSARLNLAIEVSGPDLLPRPRALVESGLFRIAQEAVINAARHASATRIALTLGARDGRVVLTISDDGAGFDLDAPLADPDHWGLRNMRERAQAIDGTLQIETTPGAGTRITVEAPLEAA